ncbi:MAG: glycosyltransferase family 2 protein [Coriobacteriia bacterium]|nr:glycosyltransferase family 2 protein [Coriobacteriia bacterium]
MSDATTTLSGVPAVSIVTAAYNAASTLAETVSSVFAQTRPDWELVIVDDGSTDATRQIAAGFAAEDPRVRVVSQANAGTAAARNAGVREARAEWLCMLDADDLLMPTFLERMIAFREEHPGYDIYSPVTTMLLRDGRRVPLMTGRDWETVRSVSIAKQMRESSIAQVSLVRREVLDRVGGYRSVYSEDYDLWLRALILGARQLQVPEALWVYRRQEGSKTTALVREAESILEVLTDARAMPELSPEDRAACDDAIVFAESRIGRRNLEEALLRGEYAGARAAYVRHRRAFPGAGKYALGFALMMLSPRLYARIKAGRMV